MLYRYIFILVTALTGMTMYGQNCPTIFSLSVSKTLPNPCEKIVVDQIFHNNNPTLPIVANLNFGDGSPIQTNTYSGPASAFFASAVHSYTVAGTYTVTLSIVSPQSCQSSKTQTVTVSCSTCSTIQNLSTGFNRANNLPITSTGTYDPYWYIVKKQTLTAPPSSLPIPSTETYYTNLNAFDIVPNGGYGISLAPPDVKYISLNSIMQSQDALPYLATYRTYFVLPATLPANVKYSLLMSLRADDAIYQVSLNGTDIKAPGYVTDGGSYIGNPLSLSINSCDQPIFVGDTNYLDITTADTYLAAHQFEGEILLQQCSDPCVKIPCENCIGSFSPTKDKKYVVSAWAREDGNVNGKKTFTAPELYIDFPNSSPVQPTIGPFIPSGAIIDGWQRIEGEFYLPPGTNYSYFSLRLNSNSGDCFFDDIRVFPYDGSIKTYVYHPVTLRLSAELDERNYATMYEYDEEGKLVRVKKETEKGIMTIQENKNNTVKAP
jgi:hypothetical protein